MHACLRQAKHARALQVVPTMGGAIALLSLAAAVGPFAMRGLLARGDWRALGAALSGAALTLALSAPLMLFHAYSTAVVFTSLHRSVPWSAGLVSAPTAAHKWVAGPPYLTRVPFAEEESDVDFDGAGANMDAQQA
jgi:hypothetical protein